jgi:hypothetical protein
VLLVSTGAEKRIGGARFPQRKQPGKELETSKLSLGLNGSYTCRRSPNNFIPNTITGLNGSLSWYVSFSAMILLAYVAVSGHIV